MPDKNFLFTPTTESDRTYIARLNFLTDVHGDEGRAVTVAFAEDYHTYVERWTPERGGVIAWSNHIPAGGAWLIWGTEDHHGYGHVESGVPEVAVAVETAFRGHGLGRLLLNEAAKIARAAGAPGISLSVDADNHHAHEVYLKLGYKPVPPSAQAPGASDSEYHRLILRFS
ncbi:GNAT family N-acetyltransferase [Corynebacterium sp. 35RC1]|nr:GNAT family N-acetyltransferase [Corynebacterium sp. 35RC1]